MRLPPPSQTPSLPHLTLAQEAASCGATKRALLHVDRALIDGMVEDFGMDGTLEWYHKILKLGRRAGGPGATQLIIDQYLSKVKIQKSQLHLLGVSTLLIATKYEEIYPPELRELLAISENKFTKE